MMAAADQRKRPDTGNDGDRLSSLPDDILSHIFSFLETKHAAGTSILSRRWKDLWMTGVSNLDLVEPRFVSRSKSPDQDLVFARFVDRVLSHQHKNLNSLRRLRLKFSMNSRVSSSFFCKMELESASPLEELDFRRPRYFHMRGLPESFYTLKNLKVLKLQYFLMIMPLQGSVFLPSMKTLELLRVEIVEFESLARLFSGCPVLETIRMEHCYSPDKNEEYYIHTASLPLLKNLAVIGDSDIGYHRSWCPIVIQAPSLEHLHLEDFDEFQCLGSSTSSQLSCLVSVRIDARWNEVQTQTLIGFLTRISNAKEMWLSWRVLFRLPLFGDQHVVQTLLVFPNLTHLTLEVGASSGVLHPLLCSAPKLQCLAIHFGKDFSGPRWEESVPVLTPGCLLSSLEEVEFHDFVPVRDDETTMIMLAYLLKAGAVLKKVSIHIVNMKLDVKDLKFLASVLKLPRGSSACEVRIFQSNNEIHIARKQRRRG